MCNHDKITINGFIIVEGITDVAFLSSFLDCEIVYTGGFSLPRGTISYIKALSKKMVPLVLTDPDAAGDKINNMIRKHIDNSIHIKVPIPDSKKKKGIAESKKSTILECLKPYYCGNAIKKGNISLLNLERLGIVKDLRLKEYISNVFSIGTIITKKFLHRLNVLNISYEELYDKVSLYGNK